MTISPFDPLRFPRYPLNNITPFTYRDGRTFLELIESLKNYINEDYVAAVNALLDELNLATEESITGIEATFNSQLTAFNTTVDTLINETETEIANKILSVDSQVSAKLATVDTAITNMTTTVNNAVAGMNENATVQIALVNSTMQGYMDDIDDQIAIINEKSGPVGVQEVLLTGDYVLNHNPLFPFTHPINYMFVQNATGGHKVIAGENVFGSIEINTEPLAWTRVTMYPAEGDSWIVETSTDRAAELLTDIVHKSFDWAVQSGRQDLTTTVMYNTFPCATRTDSGRIIVGWPAQAGHVMVGTDVSYLKWSDDNGATWSNPVALPAGHGIIGLASLGNRVAMVTMRIDAPYRRMFVSFSTASTVATTWTPPMDIGNVLYSTWHFPCSISWFDDGTADGSSSSIATMTMGCSSPRHATAAQRGTRTVNPQRSRGMRDPTNPVYVSRTTAQWRCSCATILVRRALSGCANRLIGVRRGELRLLLPRRQRECRSCSHAKRSDYHSNQGASRR